MCACNHPSCGWCVWAHLPVQGALAWDAPGFLWELPTFQFWWIRHLLFQKSRFSGSQAGVLEVQRRLGRRKMAGLEGGLKQKGNKHVFVGLVYIMHKWIIWIAESSTRIPHPVDHQRVRLSPGAPLTSISLFLKLFASVCYHGKVKKLANCKQNHVCLL